MGEPRRDRERVMVRLLMFVCFLRLFLAGPLYAQESYHEFERGLNLSESQKAQAWAIQRKYIAEWRALTDESARKRLELRMLDPARPGERERAETLQRDLVQIETLRRRLFRSTTGRYRRSSPRSRGGGSAGSWSRRTGGPCTRRRPSTRPPGEDSMAIRKSFSPSSFSAYSSCSSPLPASFRSPSRKRNMEGLLRGQGRDAVPEHREGDRDEHGISHPHREITLHHHAQFPQRHGLRRGDRRRPLQPVQQGNGAGGGRIRPSTTSWS